MHPANDNTCVALAACRHEEHQSFLKAYVGAQVLVLYIDLDQIGV